MSKYLSVINKFGKVMRKNLLLLLLAAMFTMISCEKDLDPWDRPCDSFEEEEEEWKS